MEYKDTLKMPKTDFPMRGNLPNREPQLHDKWNEMDLFSKVNERTKGRPQFILHDGPPYANGDLHMGHALNKVLKDIIVRYKSMSGYHSPYVPGWDTHGLPIESALTKKKKVKRNEMSVAEFREKCAEYALDQLDRQRSQFKRLGILADWDNPYVTLDKGYEAQQIKVFGEMAKKGYIYKGKKPVYWSPSSESALAEAEIEYHDKRSPSIYVAFSVTDGKGVLSGDEKFIIWTTTPWTIPANLGIAVHAEMDYSVVTAGDANYVVASQLVESVATALEWETYDVVKTVKGAELEYVTCKHPIYDRESLVMVSDHVTAESGTGCVHTAPGHGEDDFLVGKRYNLDVLCPVDDKGVMTEEAPGFAGLFYDEANKPITEKLQEVGALLKLQFIKHSYPHDWRTKKPVIFRATAQWFASIKDFREDILTAIKEVNWIPHWGETRLYNMIKDREDWCISRQRTWGVPIPVFYGENGQEIITEETINHVSQLFREHGSNVWFEWDAKKLLPEGFTSEHSPGGTFTKETDIMDVWFDSGSSHQAVLEEREELRRPADLYLEGSDQYRGWFNSSLSTGVAVTGKSPYKAILSHGFVNDGEGRKMSKSIGNVILPEKVVKQYGADIIRLWVASVDYQADVRVSDDILKQVSEGYRKIRNTFRFLLGNLNDYNPSVNKVSTSELAEVDQYMLAKLNNLIADTKKLYDAYDFAAITNAVHNFCTIELSSFYLDIAKDVLYIQPENATRRRAIQSVMYETVTALTKLIAPILPHTADEVWPHIPHIEGESVFLTDMPEELEVANKEAIERKWDGFMNIRNDVLKALENARNEKVIGKSLTASLKLYPTDEAKELLTSLDDLHQLFIVSSATIVDSIENAPEAANKFEQIAVHVESAEGETCDRCWIVSPTVGSNSKHETLCESCADIVINHYE